MERYQNFEIEDFVVDEKFREWVLNPFDVSSSDWEKFLSENPEKKNSIEKAAIIVKSLEPVEENIIILPKNRTTV